MRPAPPSLAPLAHDQPPAGQGGAAPLAAGADGRIAPRITPLIKAAKLVTPAGEYLCVVRDVSSTGVSLRLLHEQADTTRCILELQNGDRHRISQVWKTQDRAGFRFDEAADLERIIAHTGAYPLRPLRLRLELRAHVLAGLQRLEVRLLDISRQGARIECAQILSPGRKVRLTAPAMRPMLAEVRWQSGGTAGLAFEEHFGLEELALLVRDLRQGG